MAGHVARMEVDRSAFRILTGKPTARMPFGRSRCRKEGTITMKLKDRV